MPIQMVCDSTPSLVSAAIRDALHSTTSNGRFSGVSGTSYGGAVSGATNGTGNTGGGGSSGTGVATQNNKQLLRRSMYNDNDDESITFPDDGPNDLVESISQSLRQGQQVKPITYEEGPSYSTSLDKLKTKYIVLRATPADVSNGGQHNSITTVNGTAGGGPQMHLSKAATNAASLSAGPAAMAMNGSFKFSSSTQQGTNAGRTTPATNLPNGLTSATGSPSAASGKEVATLPTPKRTFFPRENVQVGWKTTGRKWHVGAGMINMGNTCYLNSTLQALFHVPAIANWLLSDVQHRERCDDGGSGGSCIICAMAKTLLESQSNQSAIRPYLVYSKLRLVCKHLVPGRQEDAHEFLRYLVEAMEKSYLGRYKNSKELDQYSKETTPLNQILGGYLRSEVKCLSCQHVSTTFQHFEDLLLDIRKASSIDEALDVYFARERLEEMGYKCEACKRRVAATKQFSLERAPFALCVQLKRFSMLGGKINKHVELRSRLDLTPYSSPALKGSNGKLLYRLTSMVTHLGSTQHCGHYTAIGHTDAGGYHVFDDSSVRPTGMHNVTSTNAYILFYELESPAGAATAANGVCRTKAGVPMGQPSSTATLASMGHHHLHSDAAPSGTGTAGGTGGGSNGTPGKATGSSPARVPLGTGGGSGAPGGFLPSKLEQKSDFVGPLLPTTAPGGAPKSNGSSVPANNSTTHTTTSNGGGTAGSLSNSLPERSSHGPAEATTNGCKDSGAISSPSSTSSTLSNASPLPSPVKQQHTSCLQPSSVPSSPSQQQLTAKTLKLANGSGGSARDDRKPSPLLPSMPKLLLPSVAPSSKPAAAVNGSGGKASASSNAAPSVVSLVPYETDDDSDDSSDNANDDGDAAPGRKAAAVTLANGSKRGQRLPSVYQGVKPAKVDRKGGVDSDGEADRGGVGSERQELGASRSPQMIKTKTGLWKVSRSSTADQLSFPDSSSSSTGGSAPSSKASSPATSGGSSPASSPGQQPQLRNGAAVGDAGGIQLTNGHRNTPHSLQLLPHVVNGAAGGGGDKPRKPTTNGYHHQGNGSNSSNSTTAHQSNGAGKSRASSPARVEGAAGTVQALLKLSHRGYGAAVKSWDGQETAMDRELASERRDERKRQLDDDRELEMDRGRVKKSKGSSAPVNGGGHLSNNGTNMFQAYQNHQNAGGGAGKWNGNGGSRNNGHHHNSSYRGGGGGGYYQGGNGQRQHGGGSGNGFRNNGRRFGGRNGGGGGGSGFHSKAYHHHQRSESSGGGGMASTGGGNGVYHR